MKCPMQQITTAIVRGNQQVDFFDCIKEKCTWWDKGLALCCIRTESYFLAEIAASLRTLIDKMPHEEQFRK